MSMIKRRLEDTILELSEKSGYSSSFLFDRFDDMMDKGEIDWDRFVAVTMEHKW